MNKPKSGSDKNNTLHHYVQKSYLNGFAIDGRIDVILRESGDVRKGQRTVSIASERGLYTIHRDNGEKDGVLEDIFAERVEEPAMQIIKNMTSVFPFVPQRQDRYVMAEYMALQYLRTPEAKRRFEAEAGLYAAINLYNFANDNDKLRDHLKIRGEAHDDDTVEAYRQKVIESLHENEIIPNSTMWHQEMLDGIPHIAHILMGRYEWHLLYYDKPSLLTGDHPVVLRQIKKSLVGTGFMNADEILFPLTVHYALLLSTDYDYKEEVNLRADPKTAHMMNWYIKHNSFLEIYSHPALTSDHSGEALGQKILTQISGAWSDEVKFLDIYSGELGRKKPLRQ